MMTQYYKAQMAMNSHDWEGFLNAVIVIYTELNEPMPDLLDLCASKKEISDEEKVEIMAKELIHLQNHLKELGKWAK